MADDPPVVEDPAPPAPIGSPKAPRLSTPKVSNVMVEVKPEVWPEGISSEDDWAVTDLLKDAAFFAVEFGLPNVGENVYKIAGISDTTLLECFVSKDRNGFKVGPTMKLIPYADILHLTQIVDGYDLPINMTIPKSFAKGIYVERVLNRKVNWASYAESKLKGQLNTWKREGKGRPVGPPCVRLPRRYLGPSAVPIQRIAYLPGPSKAITLSSPLKSFGSSEGVGPSCRASTQYSGSGPSGIASTDYFVSPFIENMNTDLVVHAPPKRHLLLFILETEMQATEEKLLSTKDSLKIVQDKLDSLAAIEAAYPETEAKAKAVVGLLEQQLAASRVEQVALQQKHSDCSAELEGLGLEEEEMTENELAVTLNQQIELLEEAMTAEDMKVTSVNQELVPARRSCAELKAIVLDVPKTRLQLRKLCMLRETMLNQHRERAECQKAEYSILEELLATPRLPLKPEFVPTSSRKPASIPFSTPCPLCCNGFHCYNWMPISCGHVYHPSCLLSMLSNGQGPPKCRACQEVICNDWLRTWGLPLHSEPEEIARASEKFIEELKGCYGTHGSHLAQRRSIGLLIAAENQKVGLNAKGRSSAHGVDESGEDVTSWEYLETGSTPEIPLLIPKIEDAESKPKAGVKRRADNSAKAPRKVTESPPSPAELGTAPLSPDPNVVTLKDIAEVKTPQALKSEDAPKPPARKRGARQKR